MKRHYRCSHPEPGQHDHWPESQWFSGLQCQLGANEPALLTSHVGLTMIMAVAHDRGTHLLWAISTRC